MGASLLSAVFGRLRRRAQLVGMGTGLLGGVVAAAVAVIVAVWLDLAFELSPGARLAGLAVSSIVGCGCLTAIVYRFLSQSTPAHLARRLDQAGETGGQIRSGVDLSGELVVAQTAPAPDLCVGLARYAVQRAAALAVMVPGGQVIPLKPLARFAVLAAVVGLAIAAAVVLLPDIARTQWFRFLDPYGDHPPYAASTFVVEPAGTKVRYGEGLDIFVTVEGKPADGLELVLQPREAAASDVIGDLVPMFQEPGGKWRAALTNVTTEQNYFVRSRRARSSKYALDVITVPEIKDVRFRIIPPAYARRGVYEGPLPQAGLAGLVGTKVEIILRSNRPLASADGKLTSAEEAEDFHWPAAAKDVEVIGSFVIRRSGRLDVMVTDEEGQKSKDAFSAPVVLLPDERPFVRLLEPKAVSFATPTSQLPVVVSAEDDYGVSRLQLFRGLNDSRYSPLEIPAGTPSPTQSQQVTLLPLSAYDLTPGDEIKLFARAEDNDPAGSKGAESSVVLVRIISDEELASMIRTRDSLEMLTNKYSQVQRRLEALAQEMEALERKLDKLPPDSLLAAELRKELERLVERMQEEAEAIAKLGKDVLPYELDKELRQHLSKTAQDLKRLVEEMKKLAGKKGMSHKMTSEELKNLIKKLGNQRKDLKQQTGPPIDKLSQAYPLMEDEQRFVDIFERQKDLAERLGAFRGRDKENDPAVKARMRELEAEQRQIREDLMTLLDDIEEHAAKLPEDMEDLRLKAEDFAAAVRSSGVDSVMKDAETGLAEFAGTKGVTNAERARDILDGFIKKSKEMGDEASSGMGRGFQPSMAGALSQTAAQLLAAAGLGKKGQQPGQGQGSGGGYSSRRSSLQNVGLYGNAPRSASPTAQGMGSGNKNSPQSGRGKTGISAGSGDAGGFDLGSQTQGTTTGEAAVPPQYRRKVGRYFQRIADEIGDQEK
jgi:hypothetical protein